MKKALLTLIERINCAQSLEVAKAYADAALIVAKSPTSKLVSVTLEPGQHGTGYPFINVIKEVRSIFGLGLKESKDLVEAGHTWTKMTRATPTWSLTNSRLKARQFKLLRDNMEFQRYEIQAHSDSRNLVQS